MSMKIEVEQKFPLRDAPSVEKWLMEQGATYEEPVTHSDYYFQHPCRDFATTDEALRIRAIGDKFWITYKGPRLDKHTKTRRELELKLTDDARVGEGFATLLDCLGFEHAATVVKQRRRYLLMWRGREYAADMDVVDELGDFIEIETRVDLESEVDAARHDLTDLANQLGLTDPEPRNYLELLQERVGP
ncbi:MAG: class IV adenylate cyclase [Planctomycetales bacterium]|nr:class IV adenylate cyclase [Planctomycetales bacterium]